MIVSVFVISFLVLVGLGVVHARRQWRKAQEWAERCSNSARGKHDE